MHAVPQVPGIHWGPLPPQVRFKRIGSIAATVRSRFPQVRLFYPFNKCFFIMYCFEMTWVEKAFGFGVLAAWIAVRTIVLLIRPDWSDN